MNQMARPGNAARLSEDIGDVLSAIRRLIAEDEALDYARDTLEKQQAAQVDEADQPVAVVHPFTRQPDGHAAMARRMVAEGTAALTARMGQAMPQPAPTEMMPASFRSRLVADDSAPAAHGGSGRLVASRDLPARRDHARLGVPPLRLREADRVITGIAEEADQPSSWIDHQQQIADLRSSAIASFAAPRQISAALIATDDDDDFAEAFDAKARMRPAVEMPMNMASIAAEAQAEGPADEGNPADAFWQTYANTPDLSAAEDALTDDAEDDTWISSAIDDNVIAIEAGTFSETYAALEPAVADADEIIDDLDSEVPNAPVFSGLSIPSYPADEVVELIAEDQPVSAIIEAEIVEIEESQAAQEMTAAPVTEMPEALAEVVEVAAAAVADPVDAADEGADDEETTIRELIREMVQEELHGELGQRFSRNLRAVIRREVASAIDDHLERL